MTENIKTILAALFLMPILYSCQSDFVQENLPISPEETAVEKKISVKAFMPDSESTRAHITYGNKDEDKENFIWDLNNEINIINYSKFFENPYGVKVEVERISNNGKSAEFSSIDPKDLNVMQGDTILSVFGEIGILQSKDDQGVVITDQRKIVRVGVGTEAGYPQMIIEEPDKKTQEEMDETLNYMKDNFKMYALHVAEEDNVIPEIHFNLFSSIMRVTLHNATGSAIYPTKLEFNYFDEKKSNDNSNEISTQVNESDKVSPPTGTPVKCFLNTNIYFSAKGDEKNGFSLITYDSEDDIQNIYGKTDPFTAKIGTTINGKEGTEDSGGKIAHGQSYDLYIATVPRLGNNLKGNKLYIDLIVSHDTDHPYRIILDPETLGNEDGFNIVIEPGKRYWFDLTAVKDEGGNNKLMLTSKWEELQKQQGGSTPEQTNE